MLEVKDHLVSGERFRLERHESYDLLRTTPLPDALEGYYRSEAYVSHTDRRRSALEQLYYWAKRWNLKNKTRLLRSLLPERGNLLDIGAGTGDFVRAASQDGWEAFGLEPNADARRLAGEKGVALAKAWDDLDLPPLDCITLWHVLEHIPDLERQTRLMHKALRSNGYLILALPNFKSYDAAHYQSYWAAYDVPRHVWHFSRQGLEAYFRERGFVLQNTRPMRLDAFYISWLSEKYKGNTLAPLSGFLVGLWSNLKALGSQEYSSLIYILQKREKDS